MKLLLELYNIHSPSGDEKPMMDFIENYLESLGVTTYKDTKGNLYGTKGESDTYPCIVAHTDEVFTTRSPGFKIHILDEMILATDTECHDFAGLGADDKNGIWVALKAFEEFDYMKGAFFVEEEIGCIGSSNADMTFFEDVRFVLQCDRTGYNDFIYSASGTELHGNEFVSAEDLFSFGYKPARGIMTDVMQLKDNGLEVSAANISCGYYNAHQENEFTVFSDLENAFELVAFIFNNYTEVYRHIPTYGAYWKTNGKYSYIEDDFYNIPYYDSWEDYDKALLVASASYNSGNSRKAVERDVVLNFPNMDDTVLYHVLNDTFGDLEYNDFMKNSSGFYEKIITNSSFYEYENNKSKINAI